jgi:transposase-like protein
MTTKSGKYAAMLHEDADAAANYSHIDRITDPKVREFLQRMCESPRFNRKALAAELQVSRQTLHSWIRNVRGNTPIRPRGRRPLYDGEPCVTVRIEVPLPVATMLIARYTVGMKKPTVGVAIVREMEARLNAQERGQSTPSIL